MAEAAASWLAAAARLFDLALSEDEPSLLFGAFIEALQARTGRRVVVLVDEYAKPVLDAPSEPDKARAKPRVRARALHHYQGLRRQRPLASLVWKVMRVVPKSETSRAEELPPVLANV